MKIDGNCHGYSLSAFNQNAANMSADWDIAVRNMGTLVQKWNIRHLLGREGEDPEQTNPGKARVFWSDDPNPAAGGRSITYQSMSFFLFNNKVERISLEQLYTAKELGGLGLVK